MFNIVYMLNLCICLWEQALQLEAGLDLKRKAIKLERKALRRALQGAAQQQLMVKEKNKTPSAAMRISWVFNKLAWQMLCDGESFADAEINNMVCLFVSSFRVYSSNLN